MIGSGMPSSQRRSPRAMLNLPIGLNSARSTPRARFCSAERFAQRMGLQSAWFRPGMREGQAHVSAPSLFYCALLVGTGKRPSRYGAPCGGSGAFSVLPGPILQPPEGDQGSRGRFTRWEGGPFSANEALVMETAYTVSRGREKDLAVISIVSPDCISIFSVAVPSAFGVGPLAELTDSLGPQGNDRGISRYVIPYAFIS